MAFELNREEGKSLTIDEVFGKLKEIKEASGKGSKEEKTRLLSSILQRAIPVEGEIHSQDCPGKAQAWI